MQNRLTFSNFMNKFLRLGSRHSVFVIDVGVLMFKILYIYEI